MRFIMLGLLTLLGATPLTAVPDWVVNGGVTDDYPSRLYLLGVGISAYEGRATPKAPQSAQDEALKNLGQKIKVSIDASSRSSKSSIAESSYSSYLSDVKTLVSLDLSGVDKYETYFNPELNRWMALAVLEKGAMLRTLETKRIALVASLERELASVKDYMAKNRLDLLQRSLVDYQKILDDMIQNVTMARNLGADPGVAQVLDRYYQSQNEVQKSLRKAALLNLDDVVQVLINGFPWSELAGARVSLVPAVYKTTEISGDFARSVRDALADGLPLRYRNLAVVPALQDPTHVLRGSFFESNGGWQFSYRLTRLSDGQSLGLVPISLDAAFTKAQTVAFLPDNINKALEDWEVQAAIYDNPVLTELQVWTNKGKEGLVFEEGEYLDIYVQSNRAGYVSVVYHLAGKTRLRVPVLQNQPIFPKDINRPVKLERLGPFSAPYGSEAAQVFFSPEKIPEYKTTMVTIEGVDYPVLAEDYPAFLTRTRGVGGLPPSKTQGGAPVAAGAKNFNTDVTLAITSVPKKR